MLITGIHAEDFLSFRSLDLTLDGSLTFITGPNGVGKTNLGRCLDIVLAVLEHHTGKLAIERVELYRSAGRNGAATFNLSLDIELDQQWERDLVGSFVRAAFISGEAARSIGTSFLDRAAEDKLAVNSLSPLWSGTLRVYFDAAMRSSWWATWEFNNAGKPWHIPLVGQGTGRLEPGAGVPFSATVGHQISFTRFMLSLENNDPAEMQKSVTMLMPQIDLRSALNKSLSNPVQFDVAPLIDTSTAVPVSIRELASAFLVERPETLNFTYAQVIAHILQRAIVFTENRRVPPRRYFDSAELKSLGDLRDGSNLAGELFRLKNGNVEGRNLYREIEKTFSFLTGQNFGIRAAVDNGDDRYGWILEPTILTDSGEIPIEFSGAGIQEALMLSTLLSGPSGRFFLLDEPAVNLEPTMQRRLITLLRNAGQCLVITHSPDMVPVDRDEDLASIVRLAPQRDGPVIRRVRDLPRSEWMRWVQLLEPSHVRALLFAASVILCEGSTEVGALSQWWRDTSSLKLPDPEAANMPIISVDGDRRFGTYIDYLDAFGIPWAIVADGPALRSSSDLAKHLLKRAERPPGPSFSKDFSESRDYWRDLGVFSFADQFGDDGKKLGEFEAYLERVDGELFAKVGTEGRRSKPRRGAYFAAQTSQPKEVADLYVAITEWLKLKASSPLLKD